MSLRTGKEEHRKEMKGDVCFEGSLLWDCVSHSAMTNVMPLTMKATDRQVPRIQNRVTP